MQRVTLKDKTFVPYITSDKIQESVRQMSKKINTDLEKDMPLFLVVLNGSFMFAADLLKEVTIPCEISFIKLASYHGTSSTGTVTEMIGLTDEIKGRTVVVIEDIVDTGVTIEKLVALLIKKEVKQIKIASFLLKPDAYTKDIKVDYVGMEIPNDFVVGYGLDYDGLGRNMK
ncbi:MAG: hypoxanthine phosphoribosyltransferase, partial [Bacteroidia bacterium]|nr:hypoxanthine phosphoribosyltransferase [Bacteroidia bacterium]